MATRKGLESATLNVRTIIIGICVLLLITASFTIADGQDPYFVYANGATSERNLPVCSNPKVACNIVEKRFWLPPMVRRLCKCPDRSECRWEWSNADKYTIMLNSRAQMKFCGQVGNLFNCTSAETAMITESHIDSAGQLIQLAEINCYCPIMHFFERRFSNVSNNVDGNVVRKEYHICTELHVCFEGDFCGYITATLYETYFICTCPNQHICIMESRQAYHVLLPLYEGPAYRGICMSYG